MPFALIIIGLVLTIAGVRDKASELYDTIKGDFTGKPNFMYWLVAIIILGALGYIDALKNLSRSIMVLLIIVMILSNGGFFDKFNQDVFGSKLNVR